MLTVGIEQGLEVAGVFEEGGELFYCFIFEGFGGDRFEIAIAVAFGPGAGIASIVGAIALAGCHAPERRVAFCTDGDA